MDTGDIVLTLRHDIGTPTGQEVVIFTPAESPLFRQTKKRPEIESDRQSHGCSVGAGP